MKRSFCGTLDYIAPEIIKNESYNEKVDVWALGVIIFELLTK
jgi:serine/threonine protein kinase